MIAEAVRIINTWLENATYGVNKQLETMDGLGLFGSDDQPTDIAFIGNPADDATVAEWKEPMRFPSVYVTIGGPITGEGEVHTVQRVVGELRVDMLYIQHALDYYLLFRNTSHTLRAMVRSLAELNKNENEAERTQNGICLRTCTNLVWTPWVEAVGSARCTGLVQATFNLIDQNP